MAKQVNKRFSKDFGKKEKVLNYATQTYQLSRPNKVGTVMALIRDANQKQSKIGKLGILRMRIQMGKHLRRSARKALRNLVKGYMSKLKRSLYLNGQKLSTN